jgi:hypoxanthine-DNA glycosylase
MGEVVVGFAPVWQQDSRVLILGSFPSVKSRQVDFYYGNKQNRFWSMICSFFGEEVPATTDGKKDFLARHKVALWDVVSSCEIVGSQDATIKNYQLAAIDELVTKVPIERILCNGTLSYTLFKNNFSGLNIPFVQMPSTSPANPRYRKEIWYHELSTIFR